MQDHIALSVADLDAWIAKLQGEGVMFLEEPYRLGDTARRHDRRPEPRGDRTGRSAVGNLSLVQPACLTGFAATWQA